MSGLHALSISQPVAYAVLVLSSIAVAGLALGSLRIRGLISGSMTDPPALAFAGAISKSDAPSVAYANVYPLSMLLRITAAQALVFVLCR